MKNRRPHATRTEFGIAMLSMIFPGFALCVLAAKAVHRFGHGMVGAARWLFCSGPANERTPKILVASGAALLILAGAIAEVSYGHLILGLLFVALFWKLREVEGIVRPASRSFAVAFVYLGGAVGALAGGGLGAALCAVGFGAFGCAIGMHIDLHYPPTLACDQKRPKCELHR